MDAWRTTLLYCMQTEVHVYALAVAASLLLSFYPFLNVMLDVYKRQTRALAAVQGDLPTIYAGVRPWNK